MWLCTAIEDRNRNRISLTYESGRLAEVVDSAGRTLRFRADREGRVAAIEVKNALSGGRWVTCESYEYDAAGHLVTATDADGFSAHYEYDEEHRLTGDTDRIGLCFHFRYDAQGRCIESWGDYPGRMDPSLDQNVPERLASGRHRAKGVHHCVFEYVDDDFTHVVDSTHVGHFEHNEHGLLTNAHDSGPNPMRAAYTSEGFLKALEHPDGGIDRYEWDGRGNVLSHTDPLGAATSIARDAMGLAIEIVDPLGGVTRITRDARGNPEAVADPLGQVTSYRYDERGLITEHVDPGGGKTSYTYDAQGNLASMSLPNGASWRFRHDHLGRLVERIDPTGSATRLLYSHRGDLIQVTDALGGVTRYQYDGERHLVHVQNPSGHGTTFGWGGYHRLCWRKDANGNVLQLRYNREGELTAVVNEHGEQHLLKYDLYGRLIEERTFFGSVLQYRLDAMGRPSRITATWTPGDLSHREVGLNGDATQVELVYDIAGQLVERAFSDENERFIYDALGNLIEAEWSGGRLEFVRDPLGRVVRETQSLTGAAPVVVEARHGVLGARTERRTSLGHTERISRDVLGSRIRTVLDDSVSIEHEVDPTAREIARRLAGGGVIESAFDPLGRLVQRRVTGAPGAVTVGRGQPAWVGRLPDATTALSSYRYDDAGELVARIGRGGVTTELCYDPLGQLLAMVPANAPRELFRYDAAGNLYEADETPPREYAPSGRLLRKGGTEYRWDAEGRLVEKREHGEGGAARIWRYAWNSAKLLARVDTPEQERIEFDYDPFARRVRKRVYARDRTAHAWHLARDVRFVWDGDTIAHEVTSRPAGTGDPDVEVRTYCFEDEAFVPAAHREADGRWVHYTNDPIGTPERLVDDTGAVVCELSRRAWAVDVPAGARASTPIRFQGQYEDSETGLYYNRFRYYDPDSGRYISADPLGLAGGIQSWSYGRNPIVWVDPFGLISMDHDRIAHGGYYTRKAQRRAAYQGRIAPYPKHRRARSCDEAAAMSARGGPAQYDPSVNADALEREAIRRGTVSRGNPMTDHNFHTLHRFDSPVGYANGEPTRWLRAEYASGSIHGHPRPLSEVRKFIPDAEP
ncbi:RHS repeat-associated core domain-containing protein [Sorangium sp. So ce1182]|uniref:RHS repeat-associated core domain-containing protein n=1 Tax=Sorangium sp. So ce1182 TaxID=3133334 RepID=UPI003F5E6CDA